MLNMSTKVKIGTCKTATESIYQIQSLVKVKLFSVYIGVRVYKIILTMRDCHDYLLTDAM